ncbi:MAG: hypothetical protein HY864_02785 [Chloroflexi bacterium]|nr:hypothetical protein [Chloroflexota bacterium]
MSLQAILEKIRTVGEMQIQEIERNARSRAGGILAQARMEAQQAEEDASLTTSAPAIAERARILHRARLDALRLVGSVRESLVDAALEQTRALLSSLRSDSAYPTVLRTLTEEALAQLTLSEGEGKPQLLADPRDRGLMEEILKDQSSNISVRFELSCWGGVIAQSEDGRVVVINTLEARLKQATPFLRHHLAVFFEEDQFEMEHI